MFHVEHSGLEQPKEKFKPNITSGFLVIKNNVPRGTFLRETLLEVKVDFS